MQKILVLLMLFHSLSSILAICPDALNGIVLRCTARQTLTSTRFPNYPSTSFADMSLSFSARVPDLPIYTSCAGSKQNYLSLSLGTSNVFNIYRDAGALKLDRLGTAYPVTGININQLGDWVSVFISLQLNTGGPGSPLRIDAHTAGSVGKYQGVSGTADQLYDTSIKIYICSNNDGSTSTDAIGCSVSDLTMYYSTPSGDITGFAGNPGTAKTAAFYPLIDGPANSLWNTLTSTASGYLANAASSPTPASVPVWDSSNKFISITSPTQFLTFPMPDLPPALIESFSPLLEFTVSAWIKVKSALVKSTIFNILSSDGTTSKLKLTINDHQLALYHGTSSIPIDFSLVTFSFDTWHLVDLTYFVTNSSSHIIASVSVDASYAGSSTPYLTSNAFANGDILRIGDSSSSFTGDISVVKIITSASANVRSDPGMCSSIAFLESGMFSFALQCAGTNALYDKSSKCYDISSCPSGTFTVTGTGAAQNLCLSSTTGGGNGNTGNSGHTGNTGNSGSTGNSESGAIVGIVIGSVAGMILVLGCVVCLVGLGRRKKRNGKRKYIPKSDTVVTVMTTSP